MTEGREQKPNEIVGIDAIIPDDSSKYAGISRAENPAWSRYEGEFVLDENSPLYDLPLAIEKLEQTEEHVRKYVLQEYAAWKMERDCWQPPNELAAFLHMSITKNQFYADLWRY